jgi:1,4-dihydroxy-2-naphthoate octaprenyltransferase
MQQPPPVTPLQAWIMAARPRTLPAAASPVLVAAALAAHNGVFDLPVAVACLLVSLFMQIGANLANDLFDHKRGADTGERLGPTRVSAAGLISTRQMYWGIAVVFGLATLLGLTLALRAGWPVIGLGIVIILAALAYSGGPFPYGYYALGDIFVLLSFGAVAVCGTYYVLSLSVPLVALWDSIPVGLLIVNILVVNNTRDIATDTAANKRTLAVLLGRRAMLFEYLGCLLGAYLVPLVLWLAGMGSAGGLLVWLSLPEAILLYREFTHTEGRALNKTLARTARLAFLYALLFSIGMLLFR